MKFTTCLLHTKDNRCVLRKTKHLTDTLQSLAGNHAGFGFALSKALVQLGRVVHEPIEHFAGARVLLQQKLVKGRFSMAIAITTRQVILPHLLDLGWLG